MKLSRSLPKQASLTSKVIQNLEHGSKLFQAHRFSLMQVPLSAPSSARFPSIWMAYRFTPRLGLYPRQNFCRQSIALSSPSTVFVRRVSWVPLQRGNIKVQHVKFVPPKSRFFQNKWLQRILVWLILVRLLGMIFRKKREDIADTEETPHAINTEVQDETNGVDGEPVSQGEGTEEMEITIDEENAWFLPYTWPRKKPSVPYKASDDEWQEFRKLSRDGPRQEAVKGQAVEYVHYIVKHHPQVRRILGKTSPTSRYWLDIDYPMRYDEGYEMTGYDFRLCSQPS